MMENQFSNRKKSIVENHKKIDKKSWPNGFEMCQNDTAWFPEFFFFFPDLKRV